MLMVEFESVGIKEAIECAEEVMIKVLKTRSGSRNTM